jgi:hypothetical protein
MKISRILQYYIVKSFLKKILTINIRISRKILNQIQIIRILIFKINLFKNKKFNKKNK